MKQFILILEEDMAPEFQPVPEGMTPAAVANAWIEERYDRLDLETLRIYRVAFLDGNSTVVEEIYPAEDDTGPGEDAIRTWDGSWGVY